MEQPTHPHARHLPEERERRLEHPLLVVPERVVLAGQFDQFPVGQVLGDGGGVLDGHDVVLVALQDSDRNLDVRERIRVDILPALKGEDSPKGIFRLRASSVLKYAFAWNVRGRHRVVTNGVRYSASSRVKAAFLPGHAGRRRRRVLQPARPHGSPQPNC